jgi:predicted transcriptional regulator
VLASTTTLIAADAGVVARPEFNDPRIQRFRLGRERLPVINKSKRMVGMLSLGDVSHSAPNELLSECVKSVSAHH